MSARSWSRAILTILTAALVSSAATAGLSDPFPIRNHLPFHLLFLDIRPAAAAPITARGWRIAMLLTYENTLAASDDLVRVYGQDNFGMYGGVVTPPVLASVAAANADGTAYIVDSESSRLMVDASIGLRPWLEIGLQVPFVAHGTGFMDSFIDSYHDQLNLPDGGRVVFAQDRFQAGYVGDGAMVFMDAPPAPGIGDVVVRGRALVRRPAAGKTGMSAGLDLKLPTGDPERLHGSGSVDLGVTLSIGRNFRRSSLNGGAGYTHVGAWKIAPALPVEDSAGAYVAWGFAATPGTSVIGQVLVSSGAFPRRSGSDIGRAASGIAIGLRQRNRGGLEFEYGILESLDNLHNTPDVGFFFGLSRRHGP